MKKFSFILAAFAAALMTFSCNKAEKIVDAPEEDGYEYTFFIGETKATLNDATIAWESGDKVGIYAEGTTNKYGAVSVNPVKFNVYLDAPLTAGKTVNFYYPYSSSNSSKAANEVSLVIPASQTNGNMDAMPQAGIPYTVPADFASGANDVAMLHFCNLGSVIRFLVYSSDATYRTETVEKVIFDADHGLAGSFTFDLTAVDYNNASTLAISGCAAKSVVVTGAPAIGTNQSDAGVVDMVVAPGTYYGKITLFTSAAKYEYTLAEPQKLTFGRNKIKKIGLDLASANCVRVDPHPVGEVFVPATSIAAGDKILITSGNTGSIRVMGAQNSNNRTSVTCNVTDGKIVSTIDMFPMIVGAGTENASYFTLFDPTVPGYLYAASSGSNHLKTRTDSNVDSEWEITLDATGKATKFQATGSSNRKIMRYNDGNSVFSCYASGQQDVYVFKIDNATAITAVDQNIKYNVTSVEIPFSVANPSGATTATFGDNPGNCASNLAVNADKVTFDITANTGDAARTVVVNISNNGVTKAVNITQAAAPVKLVMGEISATVHENDIVFSWPALAHTAGYQISTDGGSTYGATQEGTSYTWSGLTALTSYTIYVKAIGDGTFTLDSDPASKQATTLAPTLGIPSDITWTRASKTVSWTDTNTGAGTYGTDYKYQYTIDNGATQVDVPAPGTSVVLTITESSVFKLRAVALTESNRTSAWSDALQCSVGMTAIYTANFEGSSEHRNSGSNSYSSNSYTVSGVAWTLRYADVVTSGTPLAGSANITARIAKNTTNSPSATTANILSGSTTIKRVTFLMKKNANTTTFTAQYSTDGGATWTDMTYVENTGVTNGYKADLDVTATDFRMKFSWSVSSSTGSNRDQQLDDIVVYAE